MDSINDGVELSEIKEKKKNLDLQVWAMTSSKAWEDFNVHKAFNKALNAAYKYKYMDENEEDSDD